MKLQKLTFVICVFFIAAVSAQTIDPLSTYRKEKDKVHQLEHTKLNISLDFKKKQLNGEAWLTLSPYFYATNKVTLDAKAMIIYSIKLNSKEVGYNYDGEKLIVELPKLYIKNESFTLYIKYTARPEKVQQKGGAAITQAKGLYFINADGLDTSKPKA